MSRTYTQKCDRCYFTTTPERAEDWQCVVVSETLSPASWMSGRILELCPSCMAALWKWLKP